MNWHKIFHLFTANYVRIKFGSPISLYRCTGCGDVIEVNWCRHKAYEVP